MAITTLATASQVQKWDNDIFSEYVRANSLAEYMGEDPQNPIVVKLQLMGSGKQINIPLFGRLKGKGVQDNQRLSGKEEAQDNTNSPITVRWNRNAVEIPKSEEHWTEMDLRGEVKSELRNWAAESLRDDLISSFLAFTSRSFLATTPIEYYASVDEAVKDVWLANNYDRVLFGATVSNGSSNDHSAALLNVDNTGDKLTAAVGSLAKSVARKAGAGRVNRPRIRPFRVEEVPNKEFFVMFCHMDSFRDLKNDPVMVQANRDARERNLATNPLFQDGDLIYDGVIYREVPEIPTLTGAGAGGIDVAPNFLCGAGALGVAWGQKPKSRLKKEDDYEFFTGLGIEECRGVAKLWRDDGTIQNGMVTVYTAGVASA